MLRPFCALFAAQARHGKSRFDGAHGEWFLKKHGSLALMAVVAEFLAEPLDDVEARLGLGPGAARGLDAPKCIGLHVRHGDSCGRASGYAKLGKHDYSRRRSCPPLRDYLGAARRLKRDTGYASLFVATDDVEVADAIVDEAAPLGFHVTILSLNRSKYGPGNANGEKRHTDVVIEERPRSDFDHAAAAREVYADIVGLARCDALVGPLHSTMDMLVLELVTARLGRPPPFVSMDDPWCSDDPSNSNNFCPDYVPPMARRPRLRRPTHTPEDPPSTDVDLDTLLERNIITKAGYDLLKTAALSRDASALSALETAVAT